MIKMRLLPVSDVELYSNVEIDSDESLVFSSIEKQAAYFTKRLVQKFSEFQVVKKEGTIKLDIPGTVACKCNYLSFKNPQFDNKRIYCRITDYDFTSPDCTTFFYYIDYFQTWMFDFTMEDSYIIREHLNETDYTKAETNPYDPSIFQFRTAEQLAISKDLEKPYYEINKDEKKINTKDGESLYEVAVKSVSSNQDSSFFDIIYFADVDWDAFEENSENVPKTWFNKLLQQIKTMNDFAYYVEPGGLLSVSTHIAKTYPHPYLASYYNTSYWMIVLPHFTSGSTNYIGLDDIIKEFTTLNIISSIINIYSVSFDVIVSSLFGYKSAGDAIEANVFTANTSKDRIGKKVKNKKLLNYPFSYMRLITPAGDVKELHYECFKDNIDGNNKCKLGIGCDVNTSLTMMTYPIDYKMGGFDINKSGSNLSEGILFNQIPTSGYITDSWLAQKAAVSSEIVKQRTTDTLYNYGAEMLEIEKSKMTTKSAPVAGVFGAIDKLRSGDVFGTYNSAIGAGASVYDIGITQMKSKQFENKAQMSDNALAALTGDTTGAVYDSMKFTRPAYAANQYIPNTGDGLINFTFAGYVDILLLHVQLSDAVLKKYDEFFTNFGYTQSRNGLPYVYNFMRGKTTNDEVPHWEEYGDKEITYIKTANARIINVMQPVSDFISALLNNGLRCVKGDDR